MNIVLKKKILVSAALQNFDVQISSFKAWANKTTLVMNAFFQDSLDLIF